MCLLLLSLSVLSVASVGGQVGPHSQRSAYVTVREGAHMFYWLYHTTASGARPLVVWLQGGPGGSSTGIGNFRILGPLDLALNERNHTWIHDFNVVFVDNPVGTGFSYVEELHLLTTTNDEIAVDFLNLMRGFYVDNPELTGVPLYICGQSYGGKMAVDMALRIKEAEAEGTFPASLRGIAMGNAWIEPAALTRSWAPLLLAAGLVDGEGHAAVHGAAQQAQALVDGGQYGAATDQWARTQWEVFRHTTAVDFYDITAKVAVNIPDTRSAYEISRELAIRAESRLPPARVQPVQLAYELDDLMHNIVAPALNVPPHVRWGSQSNAVFDTLREDFMKPVTQGIEKLLNETDVIVLKYNGNLDLICSTPGQLEWVERLQWPGAAEYGLAPRLPLWVGGQLEGYWRSHGNLRFFWVNVAGHSVPAENPAATRAFLRDMTNFG